MLYLILRNPISVNSVDSGYTNLSLTFCLPFLSFVVSIASEVFPQVQPLLPLMLSKFKNLKLIRKIDSKRHCSLSYLPFLILKRNSHGFDDTAIKSCHLTKVLS